MKRILIVFGTRPEAIKMCPLIKELKKENSFKVIVCVTGQHKEMLQQVLDIFNVIPDYDLHIMKTCQTLYDVTENVLQGMRDVLNREKPDIVLVHGDTTTTYATAMAAFYQQIPIGHVEAGLRTYNLKEPYPEEFNRQSVSIIADYHFAPTQKAKENLLNEGKKEHSIFVTGNTVIDALKTTIHSSFKHEIIEWAKNEKLILLTAHRRENIGKPLLNIFEGVKNILDEFEDVKVVYPIHMNPQVREIASKVFMNNKKIKVIEPLDVVNFHNIINYSYLVLTDSGGIQEEAPALGKPVLVLRNTTERPEGVEAGTLKLVGTDKDVIIKEVKRLLVDQKAYDEMSKAVNPYGDGKACERIVSILRRER